MIKRRQLLKYLAATGMGLGLPSPLALAQTGRPDRFWVSVNASGGWDPTSLIDPKGNTPRLDGRGPVNNFSSAAIRSLGNIRFLGDYPPDVEVPAGDDPGNLGNFFTRHAARLMVINGIDTQTNNHDAGTRHVWSGKIEEGYPSFTALAAATTAPGEPLAFISNGGYDHTASLVAPARIGGGDVFQQLAFPNAGRPSYELEDRSPYFIDSVYSAIESARAARLQRLRRGAGLPLMRRQLDELMLARSGENNLNQLVRLLPGSVSGGLAGQAEVAIAAFASGVAVSANLNTGGFDTHGNHDFNHHRRLTELLRGVDRLWNEIEKHGLQDKVTVIIGSDFGRTPFYNSNRGKDHWNVTSMMLMGAGIPGNRVIGATDAHVEALPINPASLQPDPNGITLTPQHIHLALRQLAGVPAALSGQFGIAGATLGLFSPA
ncbi:MAG: hypothetical protein RLZZ385_2377 [Pseudomonadota bacterium]|jgi:hypothetical protein